MKIPMSPPDITEKTGTFRNEAKEYFESLVPEILSIMDESAHENIVIPIYYDGVIDEARCNIVDRTIAFYARVAVGDRTPTGWGNSVYCDDYKLVLICEYP